MYERGGPIARDYEKALYWYRKAAELGNTKAAKEIADLERLVSERPDTAESISRDKSK